MSSALTGIMMRLFLGALLSTVLTSTAHADAVRLSAGHGQSIDLYVLVVQFDRSAPMHESEAWTLTGHVDLGIGEFQGHGAATRAFGAIGKLRWQRRASPFVPFVELGFGLSVFSDTLLGGSRHLGGAFEFTEVVRSGYRFGDRKEFEVALYGQHFSNAGLGSVNEGITYAGVSIAWYFR